MKDKYTFVEIIFIVFACSFFIYIFYALINVVFFVDFSHGLRPYVANIWCGDYKCLDK